MLPWGLTTFRLYAYAGVALLVIGLFATIQYLSGRVDAEHGKRLVAEADLASAVLANASNQKTIGELQAANAGWAATAKPSADIQILAASAAALAAELKQTRAELDRLAQENDDGKPDCARMLASDFGAMCPFYAVSLRARARGDADGGGQGLRPRPAEDPAEPPGAVRREIPLSTRRDAG